jgi:DNA-directed RNA polymerase subunit RPC12/RpoP/uncharacterized membrane protein YkoI
MENTSSTILSCTQCGGELHPDEGQSFVTCPYCSATVFIDKARVVFHWFLSPTLDEQSAATSLARWMSGSQTVKDLDKKSKITGSEFRYFPLWYFKWRTDQDREEIALEPAAATSVTELRRLSLPAGDLKRYESSLDADSESPTVPLNAALDWFQQEHPGKEVLESALVHVPVYDFKYEYQGKTYTAVVEAATGVVLANIFPEKAEAPFQLVGIITALVFLCAASIPIISYFVLDEGGLVVGLGIGCGVAGIAAPILFAVAMWVAARV